MEKDMKKIEIAVRRCTDRLGFVTEEQIQSMLRNLANMDSIKEVVDSLALNVDKYFEGEEQKDNFEASMQDLLELSENAYSSVDEIMDQVKINKSKNYMPRKYVSRRESCFNKRYYTRCV